jgi:hypothetical protein
MFDDLRCELPMPDGREVLNRSFQTKSLWCSLDRFTISATVRLIYHKRRFVSAPDGTPLPAEHVADIDMDYHGDLAMYGETADGEGVMYVVRFTHGSVEWIWPFEQLTEIHQVWLMERGQ